MAPLDAILLLFAAAALIAVLTPRLPASLGWVWGLIPLGLFLGLATGWIDDARPALLSGLLHVPELGFGLEMRVGGLGALMALLITGIGGLILIYGAGYLDHHAQRHRILALLTAFMASMLGLVLSDNLILLFIFWELTSITSYLLIGTQHEALQARKNALQALLVTGAGGLALLAGLVLMQVATGATTLTALLAHGNLAGHSLYVPILLLVLGGCFTKSAQVPFHFWLPNAMVAPTPISAFLHSATMVKAGVFLLLTLFPILGGTPLWTVLLCSFGAATFLTGALLGLKETDIKRILAYTTLAVLGLLTLLTGVGTELAIKSAILFLFGHALYKAALFMIAGGIDHATGTRELDALGGLRTLMPVTALAALFAALSKAGFPPFFGFIGKEYTYKAALEADLLFGVVLIICVLGNMLLMALAFRAGLQPFIGERRAYPHFHSSAPTLWLPPLLLSLGGLAAGILASSGLSSLLLAAASESFGTPLESTVKLWQGVNTALLLSLLTLAGGGLMFWQSLRLRRWSQRFFALFPAVQAAYDALLAATITGAKAQTRFWQSGKLRQYLWVIILSGVTLIALQLGGVDFGQVQEVVDPLDPWLILLLAVMSVALYTIIATGSRLTALVSLGVIGYGIAILFAAYGAPDLALTQILVETLTVVFFALAAFNLPPLARYASQRSRIRDAILCSVAGLVLSALLAKSFFVQFAEPISRQLGEWSYPEAKGRNVVNVILVDFRAIDTFGEVAVIVIAALGIVSLALGFRKALAP